MMMNYEKDDWRRLNVPIKGRKSKERGGVA